MAKEYEYDYTEAGLWLRDLRSKSGLSVMKLAREIGVSGNYISLLERGKRKPSVAVADALAEFYGISGKEILEQFDIMNTPEMKRIISNPSLRKVLNKMSTDKNLTDDDIAAISDKLFELLGDG